MDSWWPMHHRKVGVAQDRSIHAIFCYNITSRNLPTESTASLLLAVVRGSIGFHSGARNFSHIVKMVLSVSRISDVSADDIPKSPEQTRHPIRPPHTPCFSKRSVQSRSRLRGDDCAHSMFIHTICTTGDETSASSRHHIWEQKVTSQLWENARNSPRNSGSRDGGEAVVKSARRGVLGSSSNFGYPSHSSYTLATLYGRLHSGNKNSGTWLHLLCVCTEASAY